MGRPETAYAVIGANFGDEGKGLATDALAGRLLAEGRDPVVVRSNGGAQAGHTVVTPKGVRHVFHHVGSGALAGARTHLSRFFVAHPMLLLRELEELSAPLGGLAPITIDPRAEVTTPWDVFLNQALEASRGAGRHGSCGVGFGETLERGSRFAALTVSDLSGPDLTGRLLEIRDVWVPARLEALGLRDHPAVTANLEALRLDGLLARFLSDCQMFTRLVSTRPDSEIGSETILFEGAQGLMLDQDLGEMPHLTRSNTGVRNMAMIASEAGIREIRPIYMTRAYLTRHGAGPLPHETSDLPWAEISDPTNRPNPWQGTLRLAPLDLDTTRDFIRRDLEGASGFGVELTPSVGVSCLDQLRGEAEVRIGQAPVRVPAGHLPALIGEEMGLPVTLQGYGPDRDQVRLSTTVPAFPVIKPDRGIEWAYDQD